MTEVFKFTELLQMVITLYAFPFGVYTFSSIPFGVYTFVLIFLFSSYGFRKTT